MGGGGRCSGRRWKVQWEEVEGAVGGGGRCSGGRWKVQWEAR